MFKDNRKSHTDYLSLSAAAHLLLTITFKVESFSHSLVLHAHHHHHNQALLEGSGARGIKFKQGALPSAAAERQNSHTPHKFKRRGIWPPEFSKRRLLWSGLERFCLFLTWCVHLLGAWMERMNGFIALSSRESATCTHTRLCEESVLHKLIGDSAGRLYYYEPAIMHGLEFDLALLLSSYTHTGNANTHIHSELQIYSAYCIRTAFQNQYFTLCFWFF